MLGSGGGGVYRLGLGGDFFAVVLEPGEDSAEGFAAVADLAFGGHVEFGGGFVELGEEEVGVVAEAVGAAGLAEEGALDVVDEDGEVGGGDGECDGADEAGLELVVGDVGDGVHEFGVVVGVGGVAGDAGVAGGVDAGCAVEGVDAEAGVIGEGEEAGELGEVAGFFGGVADEGGAVFDAVWEGVGEVFEAEDVCVGEPAGGVGEFVADFDDFAGVAGGD